MTPRVEGRETSVITNPPYSYGSAGNATTSHLIMELFRREAGIELLHVPYKGAAPAMTDLVAGRLQATVDSLEAEIVAGRITVPTEMTR